MNEIRNPDCAGDTIARARAIVSRHPLPDFITDFEIKLGVMDGDPALYVVYFERPNRNEPRLDEVLRRMEEFALLDQAVLPELLEAFEDRLPFSSSVEKSAPTGE